jgi:hypothetical protein
VTPTTRRVFGSRDRASAFLRVHQGGKAAPVALPLHVRVLGDGPAPVIDVTQQIEAARFNASRETDVNVELPLHTLAPGEYVLIVETALGKTAASRSLRFAVR